MPCPKCKSLSTKFCKGSGAAKRTGSWLLGEVVGAVGGGAARPPGGIVGAGIGQAVVGAEADHFHCNACNHDWQDAKAAARLKKGDQ